MGLFFIAGITIDQCWFILYIHIFMFYGIKCKYMFMFPLKNLARKGIIINTSKCPSNFHLKSKQICHANANELSCSYITVTNAKGIKRWICFMISIASIFFLLIMLLLCILQYICSNVSSTQNTTVSASVVLETSFCQTWWWRKTTWFYDLLRRVEELFQQVFYASCAPCLSL